MLVSQLADTAALRSGNVSMYFNYMYNDSQLADTAALRSGNISMHFNYMYNDSQLADTAALRLSTILDSDTCSCCTEQDRNIDLRTEVILLHIYKVQVQNGVATSRFK